MRPFLDDLHFGLRLLWRHPSFSILALLTLALGIGANTAVFSLVRGVLLKPLPYGQPEQLFWVGGVEARFAKEKGGVSIPDLKDLREQTRTLPAIAAYYFFSSKFVITGTGEPEQVDGRQVTANFFDVMGVAPAVGRTFRTGEDQRGGPRVATLSHALWVRNYAADPGVINRNIVINGITYQIIGVMPEGFQFPDRTSIWLPASIGGASSLVRDSRSYLLVARAAAGVAPSLVIQDLNAVASRLEQTYPTTNSGFRFAPETLADHLTGSVRSTLYLLAGITGFLLLIAAANIANLLLARATTRRREVAIRHALGGSRLAILRQMLIESVALALIGGIFGCGCAWWAIRLLRAWGPAALPRVEELAVDLPSMLFALGVAVGTAILFGLAPALQATREEQYDALKDAGTRGGNEGAGRARLRGILVVAEVALAVVMLAGAGLLLESLRQLMAVDPGFQTTNTLTTELALPLRRLRTLDASAAFIETYLDRLRAIPGVQAAGATLALPMGSIYANYEFRILGDPPPAFPPMTGNSSVTPGYVEAMGVPLRQGRLFDARDTKEAPKVLLISEPFARQHFAGRNPIGQRLNVVTPNPGGFEGEIVGVVGGVRHENLAQDPRVEVYMPLAQYPYPVVNIVVRSMRERESLADSMKQALREIDKELPALRVRPLEEVVQDTAAEARARGFLTALFAMAALMLASLGLYGVMSYAVSRRTQEIGIRMAVGATPADVLWMILGQSGQLVLVGLAVGLALSLLLGQLLSSLLFGVSAFDPRVLGTVSILLLLVAMVATLVPAVRATRIDPLRALRQE